MKRIGMAGVVSLILLAGCGAKEEHITTGIYEVQISGEQHEAFLKAAQGMVGDPETYRDLRALAESEIRGQERMHRSVEEEVESEAKELFKRHISRRIDSIRDVKRAAETGSVEGVRKALEHSLAVSEGVKKKTLEEWNELRKREGQKEKKSLQPDA